MRSRCARNILLAALLSAAPRARAADRVVSLNLCTDQLAVLLAPQKVAALSPLARDPSLSVVAATARHLPWVRPEAEAVLRLHPDLVLAGAFGAGLTIAALRRQGVRVVTLPEADSFAAIRANLREAGRLLGAQARAEALIRGMAATLAALPPPGRRRAILWQAHGLTAGPGTLGDAVLRAAGLVDAGTGGAIGVEAMAAHPPDLLVEETAPRFPSLATTMLRHPVLAAIPRQTLPPAWLACGTPATAKAAAALAR